MMIMFTHFLVMPLMLTIAFMLPKLICRLAGAQRQVQLAMFIA
ncbi:MAG: hypothetical protein AABY73_03105 [Pseudomonadota bacterium]